MPITQQQVQMAQAQQHRAAHDLNHQVRVIAGPGTGKSFAIQERVRWLLQSGASPDSIFVVSFTRASARDLRDRIHRYCQDNGQPDGCQVSVSTLHSLALRTLRSAGLLVYPSDPLVLDNWELENVFDPEFSSASGFRPSRPGTGYPPARAKLIRLDYEAFCGTGQWTPPNYIPPNPPISQAERTAYGRFHHPRTQLYACVLPGEIVRQCVEYMQVGSLNPAGLLGIRHLIVDEYQDLNPSDLAFVDGLIDNGVNVFVAGDDDQSLYSFRFASPQGIQSFLNRHPHAGDYQLSHCFRSTPNVLSAGQTLMAVFSEPTRIPKQLSSLYANANPPEPGLVYRWHFQSGVQEARSIATSCQELMKGGLPPREIIILVGDTRTILPTIVQALRDVGVPFESPRTESFLDTRSGRFIFSLLRVVCDPYDYVAHRLILGLRPQVGPSTWNAIAEAVIANNLNYREIFYRPIPRGIFSGRALTAVNHARTTCSAISHWQLTDTIVQRSNELYTLLQSVFGQADADLWLTEIAHLPQEMTLVELRDYLWADNDEQRASLLQTAYARLGLSQPAGGFLPPKVRIMTMHGAKGLSATVVFIPGLEEEILPGFHRRPYPGLVLEAARMLYVSITRARAACVLSYARTRVTYGNYARQTPSRFVPHLGGGFVARATGFQNQEIRQLLQLTANL
jgi:DNA helicase-2/ATP-dependent DNA helicase PcrA